MPLLLSWSKHSISFWRLCGVRKLGCTSLPIRAFETFSSGDKASSTASGVFDSKTTVDLLRSVVVLRFCSSEFLVGNSTRVSFSKYVVHVLKTGKRQSNSLTGDIILIL